MLHCLYCVDVWVRVKHSRLTKVHRLEGALQGTRCFYLERQRKEGSGASSLADGLSSAIDLPDAIY